MSRKLCKVPKQCSGVHNTNWIRRVKSYLSREGFMPSQDGVYQKRNSTLTLDETETDFLVYADNVPDPDLLALQIVLNSITNPELSGFRVDPTSVIKEVGIVAGAIVGFKYVSKAIRPSKVEVAVDAVNNTTPLLGTSMSDALDIVPKEDVTALSLMPEHLTEYPSDIASLAADIVVHVKDEMAALSQLAWADILLHMQKVTEVRDQVNILEMQEMVIEMSKDILAKIAKTGLEVGAPQYFEESMRTELMRRYAATNELNKGSSKFITAQNKASYQVASSIASDLVDEFYRYIGNDKSVSLFEKDIVSLTQAAGAQVGKEDKLIGKTFDDIVDRAGKAANSMLRMSRDKLLSIKNESTELAGTILVDTLDSFHPDTVLTNKVYNQFKHNVEWSLAWTLWNHCEKKISAAELNQSFALINETQIEIRRQLSKLSRSWSEMTEDGEKRTIRDVYKTLCTEYPDTEEARSKLVKKPVADTMYEAQREGAYAAVNYIERAFDEFGVDGSFGDAKDKLYKIAQESLEVDIVADKARGILTVRDKIKQKTCAQKIKEYVKKLHDEFDDDDLLSDIKGSLYGVYSDALLTPPLAEEAPVPEIVPWAQTTEEQVEWANSIISQEQSLTGQAGRPALINFPLNKRKFEHGNIKTATAIVSGSALISLIKNTKFDTPTVETERGKRTTIRATVGNVLLSPEPVVNHDTLLDISTSYALDEYGALEVQVWREHNGREISLPDLRGDRRRNGLMKLYSLLDRYGKQCEFEMQEESNTTISVDPDAKEVFAII